MQDNQAEIMLKILESIDRRFEMLNTHLANITKVLSSTDDNVRALRITSAENPVSPTPKPRLADPNANQPRERIVGVKVTILDGNKRYSKDANGVIKVVFYPATRDIDTGRSIFTKLAVRQAQDGSGLAADRFNEGDVLTVSGTLQRSEYNGKPQTTLWADEIIEPVQQTPAAAPEPIAFGDDEPFPQEDEDVPF